VKKNTFGHRLLQGLYNYFLFFLLTAFLVTCTTSLFVSVLSESLHIELTGENLQTAAKITFLNVLLLSILFTVFDSIRRKLTTDRVTKHIISAAKEIVKGDFNVRIAPISSFSVDDNYNGIIDCFNTMATELSSVETLRTDFIANVSHEMKTPLAVMQNYGTLLQSPDLTEEKRIEYAKAITDSSRRLADMMTNILKLNRLENQQIYPKTETYDLGEQLCECLLQFENVWEDGEIEIDTEIGEDILVSADRELLSLVWNNLFSNAFKFTDRGGKVTVSLIADNRYAVVQVKDTGCGMSPDVGVHIFEKFYQGDTSRATQGNGLGLALVKRVVDILQGEIGVESAVGVGTTFTVRIRRAKNELEKAG
jgi:signal transduction histidine kinase